MWHLLHEAVRRHGEDADHRFIVADSKLVYSQGAGLAELERAAYAALSHPRVQSSADLIDQISPDCHDELRQEKWYTGTTNLPLEEQLEGLLTATQQLNALCQRLAIGWGPVRSVIVCPGAFNALIDRWGSKGGVLTTALHRLLGLVPSLPLESEPVTVYIDKHGGRNHYAATLQPAFPDGLVLAAEEGNLRSVYNVTAGQRDVTITIEPRADSTHFGVALASMISKYLRELLMHEFNRFWQSKLPGLKATAGYPGDSRRYWDEIRPLVADLGMAEDAVWRRR